MTNDRDKILTAVQASEDRIGKVLEALRHRHRAQRRAKNYAGARASLSHDAPHTRLTRRHPLDEINEAFELLAGGADGRGVIVF